MADESLAVEIMSSHVTNGAKDVGPGDIVVVKPDILLMNDVTALLAIRVLEETGVEDIIDCKRNNTIIVLDHYSPPPTARIASSYRRLRAFARKHGCLFKDVGEGIMHQIAVEELVEPGQLALGADSHTITYGALTVFSTGIGSTEAAYILATGELWLKVPHTINVELKGTLEWPLTGKDVVLYILGQTGGDGAVYASVEFMGDGLKSIRVSDRLTISNMMVEGGAKTALFPVDNILLDWLIRERGIDPKPAWKRLSPRKAEPDLYVDLGRLEPMIALPAAPYNVAPVREVEGVEVDQVFIGSCTNARYEDLAEAARILKGKKVKDGVRLIVTPASRRIYHKAIETGIMEVLHSAGAVITPPGCGACFGSHMGVVGDDEVMVSTSNRNFPGRMGSPKAKIYLASPQTAAATAITGRITDPRDI
ncbi:MAG: 3-isopropylmalate dehydratase large subunit [Desulfurococcales archaeon]|nr:3-isopropylmalate dehydratase large subunit [Desulfurococcales archaeon]